MFDDDEYEYGKREMKAVTQTIQAEVSIEWDNWAVVDEAVSIVAKMIHADIRERVETDVFAKLDDTVNAIITGVMDKRVQETDRWGKPVDNPASITELLQRDVEGWLNDEVDNYGQRSGNSYGNQKRAVYLYKSALELNKGDGALTKMILASIKKQVGDLSEIVNQQIDIAVKKHFGVK